MFRYKYSKLQDRFLSFFIPLYGKQNKSYRICKVEHFLGIALTLSTCRSASESSMLETTSPMKMLCRLSRSFSSYISLQFAQREQSRHCFCFSTISLPLSLSPLSLILSLFHSFFLSLKAVFNAFKKKQSDLLSDSYSQFVYLSREWRIRSEW